MEQSLNFIEILQSVVLEPDLGSAIVLFFLSFLNELIAIIPYAVMLSGQLFFLEDPLSMALLIKLFVYVALPVGLGSAIGALPVYVLAYFGGKPAIDKWEKYLRFSWSDVERINSRFKGAWYDEAIFLFLRSIPLLPSLPINVAAGVFRMRFWPYFVLTTVGFTLRMMLMLMVVVLSMKSLSSWLFFLYNI